MSTRRTFLKQSVVLAAAACIRPNVLFTDNYKLGLQLYTIRDAIAKDLRGTLKQISAYGYQEVETYGFNYGDNKYYWGQEPKIARKILEESQLTTSAGHYDLDKFFLNGKSSDELKRYVDQCIEGATELRQQYIVWPWLSPENRSLEKIKVLADTLNSIGEQIKKGRLQLAYHNHDFEFVEQEGQFGYNILLNETDPDLVKFEMDLYWVTNASKLSPHDWFLKQPGRFVTWHLKDMDKQDRNLHTTMGDGTIDYKRILPDAKLSGVKHMFVEQGNNYIPDSMSCVKRSAGYVKNVLFAGK